MVGENNVKVSNSICAFLLVFSDGVGGLGGKMEKDMKSNKIYCQSLKYRPVQWNRITCSLNRLYISSSAFPPYVNTFSD